MLGESTRNRQTERREATRQEIVQAAWAVARQEGLAQITLREVAARVGMQAPSIYTHFESKNSIYDAMFADAWSECLRVWQAAESESSPRPGTARAALKQYAAIFFDFAAADLARHQLMNQRTIPGFTPTAEAYAQAVAVLQTLQARMAELGVDREQDIDLYVAIVGGLVDAQLANDPGGDRWRRLLDRAVDMYADNLNL